MLLAKDAANTRASTNTLSSRRRKQGEMEKQQQKGQGGGEKAHELIP